MERICALCEHMETADTVAAGPHPFCKKTARRDPVTGDIKLTLCSDINKDGNCKDFQILSEDTKRKRKIKGIFTFVIVISVVLGLVGFVWWIT